MSEASTLADLNEAREARKMREALARLDEAAKAEHIDQDGYLGGYHAILMLTLEQLTAMLCEDRAHRERGRVEHQENTLRLIEKAEETAMTYQAAAKDELAKLDRMARKAEADTKRRSLELEDSTAKVIERLSASLVAGIKDGNVIRAKAYSRALFQKSVAAGVLAVLVLFGLGFVTGRTSDRAPPTVEQGDD
jgi:hypothetical protein